MMNKDTFHLSGMFSWRESGDKCWDGERDRYLTGSRTLETGLGKNEHEQKKKVYPSFYRHRTKRIRYQKPVALRLFAQVIYPLRVTQS